MANYRFGLCLSVIHFAVVNDASIYSDFFDWAHHLTHPSFENIDHEYDVKQRHCENIENPSNQRHNKNVECDFCVYISAGTMEECRSVLFQFIRSMCCFWHKVSTVPNHSLSFSIFHCCKAISDCCRSVAIGAIVVVVCCYSHFFCMENKSMENCTCQNPIIVSIIIQWQCLSIPNVHCITIDFQQSL